MPAMRRSFPRSALTVTRPSLLEVLPTKTSHGTQNALCVPPAKSSCLANDSLLMRTIFTVSTATRPLLLKSALDAKTQLPDLEEEPMSSTMKISAGMSIASPAKDALSHWPTSALLSITMMFTALTVQKNCKLDKMNMHSKLDLKNAFLICFLTMFQYQQ